MGHGPDIIFVHGIGASQFIWTKVAQQIKNNYRVTLIDLPGFGRSSKVRDKSYDLDAQAVRLKKIIERLGIHQVYLVGSSMGGTLSLWLAKINPELVPKLAVIGPATNPDLLPVPVYKFPQLSYVSQFLVNRLTMYINMHRVLSNQDVITNKRISYALKNQHSDSSASYTFIKATETLGDKRLPKGLVSLQQPTLLLAGKQDHMVPAKYIRELSETLPNDKLFFHETGGHHLMEDEPKWVADHLVNFFSR